MVPFVLFIILFIKLFVGNLHTCYSIINVAVSVRCYDNDGTKWSSEASTSSIFFSHYLINGTIFRKKVIKIKCVSIFCTTFD
jgi:hypothetical protein